MVMSFRRTNTTVDALKLWSGDGSCGKMFPHLCAARSLTSPSFGDCEICICCRYCRWVRLVAVPLSVLMPFQCYGFNRLDTKLAEKLTAEADILLRSLETDPAPGDNADPGFKLSFYNYCRGSAYAYVFLNHR